MIYLKNKGEIDIEVIKTMGVNVKDDEGAIGYFGTGLKYAIAVFLREDIKFNLYIGKNSFEFDTIEKVIRGKTFHVCRMLSGYDALELGFTTELGKSWKPWQAYRELHSNCLDEKGKISADDPFKPEEGKTLFTIDIDEEVMGVFLSNHDKEILHEDINIEVLEGESDWIYYRGIRAMKLNKPSVFTYNVLAHCNLTEDRLLSYTFQVERIITNAIASMNDERIIKDVITCEKTKFESTIDATWETKKPGSKFLEVYGNNVAKVNNTFGQYVKEHTPTAPRTPEERRKDFLRNLKELCDEYGVEQKQMEAHTDAIMLFNGILLNDIEPDQAGFEIPL